MLIIIDNNFVEAMIETGSSDGKKRKEKNNMR